MFLLTYVIPESNFEGLSGCYNIDPKKSANFINWGRICYSGIKH